MATRRPVSARHRRDARYRPGRARKYIRPAAITQDTPVVLACRVSTWWQQDNLDDSEAHLRRAVETRGGIVAGVVKWVGPGEEPAWLAKAACLAKKHDAVILAETANRLIRNPAYTKRTRAQPTDADFAELAWWTDGVPLMTLLHPDASSGEQTSYHTTRGQDAKGNKGGRPPAKKPGWAKERREQLKPKVISCYEVGYTLGELARCFRLPRPTVQDWVRGVKRVC